MLCALMARDGKEPNYLAAPIPRWQLGTKYGAGLPFQRVKSAGPIPRWQLGTKYGAGLPFQRVKSAGPIPRWQLGAQ
jgi:hypothetical protein